MKHRLKGLLALILSLVMVFALATNAWAVDYNIWVSGTQVNDANAANVLAGDAANDGKVSYDAANNTLTLNEFVYNGNSNIYSDGNLTLKLIGNNAVTYGESGAAAVHVTGNLTIKGDNGSSLTVSGTRSITDGIHADNVTIESGTVTATGGEAGISANNNVVITGGTVEATGDAYGICANNVFNSGGMTVTITGGTVTAKATNNTIGVGIKATDSITIGGANNPTVEVGCATGLEASTVNILENSTVKINAALTAIDSTTLNMGSDPWYQWSDKNGGPYKSTDNQLDETKAAATNTLIIEKSSAPGGGAPTPPPTYYPIYIPTVEDEPEVTAPKTFDGGIASAVVVTILSATGGAWLAKKKD